MPDLEVSTGYCSDKGRKALNQDFHGICVPKGAALSHKGIAVALADGISTSAVSQIASETAVKTFLDDYYCTSEAWTVKTSGLRVLESVNGWLFAQSQRSPYRDDPNKGYVCTLSALVLQGQAAHVFHIGDTRIYRINDKGMESLTRDHRIQVTQATSHLSRAMGAEAHCELDYERVGLAEGDIFVLATDGVYEFIAPEVLLERVRAGQQDLMATAAGLLNLALEQGSDDNLSIQLVRVDRLPEVQAGRLRHQEARLPFPPQLEPRMVFDGYEILRQLHVSPRSHVFLARDMETDRHVVIKTPSVDLREDEAYIERFLTEDWIARRINSAHVLKAGRADRARNYIYTVTEYVEGQTLAAWLKDHPQPDLASVRRIIDQVARGLRAFHRMEMLHQDIKPDNILIDRSGTVRIIDFGSTRVAGLMERLPGGDQPEMLGTALYTAPEYFLGEGGTELSDQFALGVLCYHMLSGRFPYGTKVAQARSPAAQNRLRYQSVLDVEREIPRWVDEALRKAVHVNPWKRYEDLSEFVHDLHHPNKAFLRQSRPPLIERNPVAFWQGLSAVLGVIILVLIGT
jgi:serine/threonine protein phosphatase PrpC